MPFSVPMTMCLPWRLGVAVGVVGGEGGVDSGLATAESTSGDMEVRGDVSIAREGRVVRHQCDW